MAGFHKSRNLLSTKVCFPKRYPAHRQTTLDKPPEPESKSGDLHGRNHGPLQQRISLASKSASFEQVCAMGLKRTYDLIRTSKAKESSMVGRHLGRLSVVRATRRKEATSSRICMDRLTPCHSRTTCSYLRVPVDWCIPLRRSPRPVSHSSHLSLAWPEL